MTKPRLLAAVGAIAAGAMLLAGCTTDGGASSSPGAGGATFTYGQSSGITQLDPNITGLEAEVVLMYLMYSGLTSLTEDGSVEPDLATEWKQSDDGLQWTFDLRDDAKFWDGTPVTAQNVVDTIDYTLDENTASQFSAKIASITKATATDEHTVTVDLSQPHPSLPADLSYTRIVDIKNLPTINSAPNGSGPYKFVSFVPDQELVVEANPDYYGGKPPLEKIRIVKYADQTAAERALASGELTAYFGIQKNAIDTLLKNESLQRISSPNPGGLAAWEVDTTSAPFNDVRARQALAYAADRETMIKVGLAGYATPNPANSPVSPDSPFFNKDIPTYDFDLDKAKELFAEAGVKEGSKITFWTIAGSRADWLSMAEVLQADLAKIGITLEIVANETNTWLEPFYPAGKSYPNMLIPNQLSFGPVPDTFSSLWFGKDGTCECNWKGNDAYNAAVDVVTTTSDDDERQAAFQVIQAEISTNVPVLIIGNVGENIIAQKTVSGLWMYGDNHVHLEKASIG